ncbi:MAG: hypothetical protein LPK00_06675 [Bacillaceae bacterium]|nr:hypothetical protein [Bacillaceae bacterium]
MMDYQYRRKALQSLHNEKEEMKVTFTRAFKKKESILATIVAWFTFKDH